MKFRLDRRGSAADDVDALFALHRDAHAPFVEAGDAVLDRDAFSRSFVPGSHIVLVDPAPAPDGKRAVAAFMRVERRRHELHLGNLVVHEKWRRRSVGSTLAREVIDEAIRSDLPVSIHVPPGATGAITFLKQLGFVVVPSRERGLSRFVWSL